MVFFVGHENRINPTPLPPTPVLAASPPPPPPPPAYQSLSATGKLSNSAPAQGGLVAGGVQGEVPACQGLRNLWGGDFWWGIRIGWHLSKSVGRNPWNPIRSGKHAAANSVCTMGAGIKVEANHHGGRRTMAPPLSWSPPPACPGPDPNWNSPNWNHKRKMIPRNSRPWINWVMASLPYN